MTLCHPPRGQKQREIDKEVKVRGSPSNDAAVSSPAQPLDSLDARIRPGALMKLFTSGSCYMGRRAAPVVCMCSAGHGESRGIEKMGEEKEVGRGRKEMRGGGTEGREMGYNENRWTER